MDRFEAMRSFRRVVERGSFGKAADDLGLSPAGLSKQIRILEDHLGVILLNRTTRSMSLSDAGVIYYGECCRLLDEIDELEERLSSESANLRGRLRVNAPLSFALTMISPLIPKFLARFPDLKIELTLNDQLIDMIGAGFDLSIRIRAKLDDSSLVARRLIEIEQIICASPHYIAAHGMVTSFDDLYQHNCLAYSLADYPGHWRPNGPEGEMMIEIPARLSVNSSLLLRDMLVAGLGIGALPSFLAKPLLASGALVALLPQYKLPSRHVFAVYPSGRHLQPKVRAFIDLLAEELRHRA
ncbi:LysR family transcriptional regulator [Xanthobacter sp. KR7-225]|uniref:LysR family transcriptional regulator n=1 Tax=Xanthobacter sp. KR7-225 TaxID=3156613 RepID=UPI0032B54D75